MLFETTNNIDNWVMNHRKKCESRATAGEQFEFTFLPTAIVECQTVECLVCKEKFTDYDG